MVSSSFYPKCQDDAWSASYSLDICRVILETFNLAVSRSWALWGVFKVYADQGNGLGWSKPEWYLNTATICPRFFGTDLVSNILTHFPYKYIFTYQNLCSDILVWKIWTVQQKWQLVILLWLDYWGLRSVLRVLKSVFSVEVWVEGVRVLRPWISNDKAV